jgi:hypothetical protein
MLVEYKVVFNKTKIYLFFIFFKSDKNLLILLYTYFIKNNF